MLKKNFSRTSNDIFHRFLIFSRIQVVFEFYKNLKFDQLLKKRAQKWTVRFMYPVRASE